MYFILTNCYGIIEGMKKLISAAILMSMTSCTMTGEPIPLSDGAYILSNQAGFGEGIPKLKAKIYAQGKKFCEEMNKELVIIEDKTIGFPASVEIRFNCK